MLRSLTTSASSRLLSMPLRFGLGGKSAIRTFSASTSSDALTVHVQVQFQFVFNLLRATCVYASVLKYIMTCFMHCPPKCNAMHAECSFFVALLTTYCQL